MDKTLISIVLNWSDGTSQTYGEVVAPSQDVIQAQLEAQLNEPIVVAPPPADAPTAPDAAV